MTLPTLPETEEETLTYYTAADKAVAFDALVARAKRLGFPSITAALDALEPTDGGDQ